MNCEELVAGFDFCSQEAVAAGIEDVVYIFNADNVSITYDPNNPLIITGLTPINGKTNPIFKFVGTNNSFNTTSKLSQTSVGPRFKEEIDFNIAGHSSAIKGQIISLGYGNLQAIVINNYKSTDSAIDLFGATTRLIATEGDRDASKEDLSGGYSIKLTNTGKLVEPKPPRSVFIPPSLFGSGTFYYVVTALTALGETVVSSEQTVNTTSDTTGVQLTWAAIQGAVSYNVYRGTASGEQNVYYNVPTNSYLDTNITATAGTPPESNTAFIAAPSVPTLTGSVSGGSLSANTYYYKIVAVNNQGNTTGSVEASVTTTGSSSSVALSWPAVPGATSYRIYRGTSAGGESAYQTSSTNSFTDTGASGTDGSVPSSNTANILAPSNFAATGETTGTVDATYASTIAALEALVSPV